MIESFPDPKENKINSWTAIYIAPDGKRYNGELTITNKRIIYGADFDDSFSKLVEESLYQKIGDSDCLTIPKNRIVNADVRKSFIKKQIIITLNNNQTHTFDYGMLNIDDIVDAINL
ncbi:MAG TPA: hypothetical protein PKK00_12955 [Bacteroidales bacterium]|nr:hypothetical protein [Bacteroidales bacterium]HPS18144.1 hypothetical protein [Bacteroidales bacterium]